MPASSSADEPLDSGEFRARADLTLAAILRALLAVLPVLIVVGLLAEATVRDTAVLVAALALVLFLHLSLRRGHGVFVAHALVYGVIALSLAGLASYGSIRAPASVALAAAITFGGIFLGRRTLIVATLVSVVGLGCVAYAENAGWLPQPDYRVRFGHWVTYGGILFAVALVLIHIRSLLFEMLQKVQDELAQRQKAESEGRRSEERFRRVFESIPVGMTVTRVSDGAYVEVNAADQRTLGYAREELVGRTTREMGAWLSDEDRRRFVEKLRADGRVLDYPTRMRHKSGEIIACRIWAEFGEFDGESCIVTSTINVTERERVEQQRRQSEAKYAAIFGSSPDPISVTRESNSVTIQVNDAWVRATGHSREYAVGRSALDMGMWTNRDQRAAVVADLQAKGEVQNIPARFTIASGETIEVLLSGVLMTLDDESCVLWVWRDVSELRRVQRREEQARAKFEGLFDISPEGIAVTRWADAVLIEANDAALSQLGLTRQGAVGQSVLGLGIGATAEDNKAIFAQLVADGRVVNRSTRFRRADGAWLEFLLSAATLDLDGEKCVVWSWRDVTDQQRAEEEVRNSRRLLENVIDAIPMSIFAKDMDSNYILLNKRMAEFFGVSKEELLHRHTSKLPATEAARSKSLADDAWVYRNRRPLDQPDQVLARPDGTKIPYHSTKLPLFDQGGTLIGLLGINREIAEEKRAQEALRASEHRYRSLFQAAMDCILVLSPTGEIIDINEFGCRTLGYTREEMIGGSFAKILDESKLSRMLPRPQGVNAERRTVRAEQEVRAKDGSVRAVEFTAGPLPDGNILVVARDVTERRRGEKLLENIAKGVSSHTGAEFFRTLVVALCRELPAHMVFIAEAVGSDRVRTIACCVEGALAENFEYKLAGSPCILAMEKRGSVVHPQGVAELFPEDEALKRRGVAGYAGTSLFDASGKAIGILVALTREPIARKEFFVSMLEIFAARAAVEIERARADATVRELNISLERRVRERTAELEAANRDLDSFGYSVSHDLRAPLGALNGFVHLLRTSEAGRLSEDGVSMLRQLETNATRMTNLVEGLLEFSRLGRKPVTRVAIQMAVLVGDVVDELRAGHRDRRIEFRVGPLSDAYGDPVLLRQVWLNLVGNAVKYTRGRDPAVIEIGSDPATGEYVVRDNGAGFEMKYAERLFGVFERLHSESEFEGTGIGLAIVQRVVNRHGGTVRGEGRLDQGATFRFTLPAR